jgi:acyl-CoA reductase-like NAD-dependent aldehyde dehydrogenase
VEEVEVHVSDTVAKSARIVTDGKRHARGRTFYEPTVLADSRPDMLIFREETFGRATPLFQFKTQEEAIRLAICHFEHHQVWGGSGHDGCRRSRHAPWSLMMLRR